jgi:hypothetical protein
MSKDRRRLITVKGKVTGEQTIQTDEPLPLPQGQSVFVIVGELDAENLGDLAENWAREGKGQDAFELLRRYEAVVYQKFVHPFTDFVVKPLIEREDVSQAIELARQIADETDHDIALGHIILHLNRKGEAEWTKTLLEEMRLPNRCQWLGLLLKWDAAMQEARQRLSPEELRRIFDDERGD